MRHVLTKENFLVRKFCLFLLLTLVALTGCQLQVRPYDEQHQQDDVVLYRYDRVESQYLTLADFAALHQMRTDYPQQTRTLIENVLQLGQVNDPEINIKFLRFFSDSTLQQMINDVQEQFTNLDDLNNELTEAFRNLKEEVPSVEMPQVYAQIGSFDQSIIVGNKTLGISLDKYLGADYPFYREHYTDEQRKMMTRSMITPDCLGFYLLSLFPSPDQQATQAARDWHRGKIQWVVNHVTNRRVFDNERVTMVDSFMKQNKEMSVEQLLRDEKTY